MKYEFISHHGGARITVNASNEDAARKEAMIQKWGPAPDKVTPMAPDYKGVGLLLVRK